MPEGENESGGFLPEVKKLGGEAFEAVSGAMGEVGVANTLSKAVGAGGILSKGAEAVVHPLEVALSGAELGWGGAQTVDGAVNGNSGEVMDGVHNLASGGAGVAALFGGPVGEALKAGFTVGDMLAPTVFGSEEEGNKPHMEQVPEDGVFKPTTGNQYVDKALDWVGLR